MKIHLNFKGIPVLYKTLNKRKETDLELASPHCSLLEAAGMAAQISATCLPGDSGKRGWVREWFYRS